MLDAPANVAGIGTAGSLNFTVTFGYTGNYIADLHGLAAPQTQTGQVTDDPNDLGPLPPIGTVGNVLVNWTGLAPSSAFLGAINHLKDGVVIGTTIINIDTGLIP